MRVRPTSSYRDALPSIYTCPSSIRARLLCWLCGSGCRGCGRRRLRRHPGRGTGERGSWPCCWKGLPAFECQHPVTRGTQGDADLGAVSLGPSSNVWSTLVRKEQDPLPHLRDGKHYEDEDDDGGTAKRDPPGLRTRIPCPEPSDRNQQPVHRSPLHQGSSGL